MNCKPNQLCRVIPNWDTKFAGIADRFVTVTTLDRNVFGEPSWGYEGPRLYHSMGDEVHCIPDMWLRPIDNLGDDEMSETDLRVGTPEGELA